MLIRVDVGDARSLHNQIADSVRADIVGGSLTPGDRLPSARETAQALNVNVHTVLRAYQQLRDEGLLELRRARGAIVTPQAASLVELSMDVSDLVARAKSLGISRETLAALITGTQEENRS
ncbi:GntR family transcriptional regulator [Brevibacterium sp. 50QC2O2]|uniref:GntR family transcriptional regulator n=1 Tax=Brevibacterium sp. 50QC2O2 TaxID=2968459 RepID=UPI00211BE912|nr:GntR family transcriptional regulator [Brevibacterium sp. 50QC2O2]MCQ9387158.1 GntR family transcriptional regulator [Brevibacterium sp. 50QC2O2]